MVVGGAHDTHLSPEKRARLTEGGRLMHKGVEVEKLKARVEGELLFECLITI